MPRAVAWYKVYCHVFALFNLVLFGTTVWFIVRHDQLANDLVNSRTILMTGVLCAPLCLAIALMNYYLIGSKNIKKPWQVHMSNIVAGAMTCVLIPFVVPLLLAWFNPAVKRWYADH